ncbi:MAG: CoA transferase [Deltaproteobacteria bacterium]|nr:CoA transferase [Deltaproteobacteria bacterium]
MKYPLDGIRVIDFSQTIAGPFCSMVLAELGAEVIKVENPAIGDETRMWAPFLEDESGYFFSINRSKKSIALNLKDPRGKESALLLAKESDVLLENFTPGVMERLGLNYQAIKEINPKIIYCSVSAFGQGGPYKDKKGYDPVMQAMGGIMSVTGPIEGPPVKVGIPITDFFTALYAVIGITIALSERKESGKGAYLDFSMYESTISLLSFIGAFYLYEGKVPKAFGSGNPVRVPSANYKTKDNKYIHLVPNDRQWKEFCNTLGLNEMGANKDYDSNAKRVSHREEINKRIEGKIVQKNIEEWVKIFNEKGFPFGPVQTMEDIFQDPQVIARKILEEIDHPRHGIIKTVKLPFGFCDFKSGIKGPAPLLGENSREVLSEILHYNEKKIDQLIKDHVTKEP